MPKVEINSKVCKACELCILNCPKGVLALGKESNPSGFHHVTVVKDVYKRQRWSSRSKKGKSTPFAAKTARANPPS